MLVSRVARLSPCILLRRVFGSTLPRHMVKSKQTLLLSRNAPPSPQQLNLERLRDEPHVLSNFFFPLTFVSSLCPLDTNEFFSPPLRRGVWVWWVTNEFFSLSFSGVGSASDKLGKRRFWRVKTLSFQDPVGRSLRFPLHQFSTASLASRTSRASPASRTSRVSLAPRISRASPASRTS